MNIALLGATSHISKGIIGFLAQDSTRLDLYARRPDAVKAFVKQYLPGNKKVEIKKVELFQEQSYEVIINSIGIGNPAIYKKNPAQIFSITENYDNLILNNLKAHPQTLFINFSSGAVYGSSFDRPVDHNSSCDLLINNLLPSDYYRIAKLNSEAKHRALTSCKIVDLRVFNYFSRFIDLDAPYLITDMINAVIRKQPLITSSTDITRDYTGPEDLYQLIRCCINHPDQNTAYDVYSAGVVRKQELLDFFQSTYGLQYNFQDIQKSQSSPTGSKSDYYSRCRQAERIGYKPKQTSLKVIEHETNLLLKESAR